jgi:nitric oxide reductase subunit C
MSARPWWSREDAWRRIAVWTTAIMLLALMVLTFDTLRQVRAGAGRVPSYAVINQRISYERDGKHRAQAPVIGAEAPLFGQRLSEADAKELVNRGKLTVQGKNCMNCHTLLGNGAYYAPDLTKAWLDPGWGSEAVREQLMLAFLQNPAANARGFGTLRKMPNLGITEEEARGVIAYLKWMSAIDTNGFPTNFVSMQQERQP